MRAFFRTLLLSFVAAAQVAAFAQVPDPQPVLDLDPGPGNPRNSEGAFVELKDGRILFAYTHFTGNASDAGTAHIAARYSSDQGRTWTQEDEILLPNEGLQNTMSVSLLRLKSGGLAFFYLRKNADDDCRPYMRISTDDGQTWSLARLCISPLGYFVVNNDRVIQLDSGRILIPVARHSMPGETYVARAQALCYFSDDDGATWTQSESVLDAPDASKSGLQEPGVVQLADGRLLMLCRTDLGEQYRAYSTDGGNTWTAPEPAGLKSPLSPASFKRLPGRDTLLLAWNNHENIPEELKGKRTPLTLAVSNDHGQTWQHHRNLETAPDGWYCYTAIHFPDPETALLGYCAGNKAIGGLNRTRIMRLPLQWLYAAPPAE